MTIPTVCWLTKIRHKIRFKHVINEAKSINLLLVPFGLSKCQEFGF